MMTDRPDPAVSYPRENDGITESGLVPQVAMMSRALWAAPVRNRLLVLAFAIFVVIAAAAYGQIRLNSWNRPFYDALSHRNFTEFMYQLGGFGVIAGALLVQNWLVPGRAFRLANAGAIGVNPDQRMHEDARHLTELSTDLGVGLLQASILLITFVDILWALSTDFGFQIAGRRIEMPGYMVWAA